MALSFKKNTLEAIDFGGLVVQPKVDIESKLRLQGLKLDSAAGVGEAIQVIAECFGDEAEKVAEFMRSSFGAIELAQLQAYLVGGETMLERVNAKLEEI